MADTTITPAEFKVDVEQLATAIEIVKGRTASITLEVQAISSAFTAAEEYWRGPAGTSFASFQAEFVQDMQSLNALLEEMVTRMASAHDQYVTVEQTNTGNLTLS